MAGRGEDGRPNRMPGAGLDQPGLHGFAREAVPTPSVRPGVGVPRCQPGGRRVVLADRDVRPSRTVLQPPAIQGPLPARLRRAALRLAALRQGERAPRAGGAHEVGVRGAAEHVRRAAGTSARRHGRARAVGRHHAGGVHRPRLPAGRARLVGEGQDALVQPPGEHATVHLGPAQRRPGRDPREPGAVHRPAGDVARVLRGAAPCRPPGPAAEGRAGGRYSGTGDGPVRHLRRARELYRRPLRLHAGPGRRERPAVRVHPDARAHALAVHRRGAAAGPSWPRRSRSPRAAR